MGEFDLIRRHFMRAGAAPGVVLGIGDDCALIPPRPGHQLAISSDMLVEGTHFFPDADPMALGHKALAVNLSDLAAMGARPLGFTLAISLPRIDDAWLSSFAGGLFALANLYNCPLVGGDTTRGPLNLCITVFGEVAPQQALRRDAARDGDDLWLSGRTGEARLALERLRGTAWALSVDIDLAACRERLERPTPRLSLGVSLAGLAHAAIDLSDGLAGDLGHVLAASGLGADIELSAMPVAPSLAGLSAERRHLCLFHGGDDYELLFTAAPSAREAVVRAAEDCGTPIHRIGRLTTAKGLRLTGRDGKVSTLDAQGFDHFG